MRMNGGVINYEFQNYSKLPSRTDLAVQNLGLNESISTSSC